MQIGQMATNKNATHPFPILERLGEGGYGSACLIRHPVYGEVAFKELRMPSSTSSNEDTQNIVDQLQREADIHKKLRHQNIVTLYDSYVTSKCFGLILEYMKYRSVDEFIKNFRVSWQWKIQLIHEVSLGMWYLQKQQPPVIHGDLKSQNILIGDGYRAKISDFGLAHILDISESVPEHGLRGTIEYIAPEYLSGLCKNKNEKYDIYAYGILVWEILSGNRAYYDYSDQKFIRIQVERGDRPKLEDLEESIPEAVLELIRNCWHQEIDKRPNFEEVKCVLDRELLLFTERLDATKHVTVVTLHLETPSFQEMMRSAGNDKCITGFKKVRNSLVEYLDPDNGLLLRLNDTKVLTDDDLDKIEALKSTKEMSFMELNKELVFKYISPRINSCCLKFLEALDQDGQRHIALHIMNGGANCDDDERLLSPEEIRIINENMFCLVNLMNPYRTNFLYGLLSKKCITEGHKASIEKYSENNRKIDELLTILKRRSYRDFCNFKSCLHDTMQNKMVDILEKGGVVTIRVKLEKHPDRKKIESKLIDLVTGYVDESTEIDQSLTPEQISVIKDILRDLETADIRLIGNSAWKSLAVFFQCFTETAKEVFSQKFATGSVEHTLERMFRCMLKLPDTAPRLIRKMSYTQNPLIRPKGTEEPHILTPVLDKCQTIPPTFRKTKEEYSKMFIDNREELVARLDIDRILPILTLDGIISTDHKTEIEVETFKDEKTVRLFEILSRSSATCIERFWEILWKEHTDLVAECFQNSFVSNVDSRMRSCHKRTAQLSSDVPEKKMKLEESKMSPQMTIEPERNIEKEFKQSLPKLVKMIDAENGLLLYLLAENILTEAEYISIDQNENYEQMNEQLFTCLLPKISDHYKGFIKGLRLYSQEHVVLFMENSGNMEAIIGCPERPLTDRETKKISSTKHCLVELMNPDSVRLYLRLNDCITDRHSTRIDAQITAKEKNNALLNILIRRSRRDYEHFKLILRKTKQFNIVDILKKGGVVTIHIKLKCRPDWTVIGATLSDLLTKYALYGSVEVNNTITEKQFLTISNLLKKYSEKTGICMDIKGASLSENVDIYAQFHNLRTLLSLKKSGDTNEMKTMLEGIFACLLPGERDPLIETVTVDHKQHMACLQAFYRIECLVNLRNKFHLIVKYLTVGGKFVSLIRKQGILSLEQEEALLTIEPYQDQNRELLAIIQSNDNIDFVVIINALHGTNQEHIAALLLGDCNAFDNSVSAMERIERIDANMISLVEITDVDKIFKSGTELNNFFTDEEIDDIMSNDAKTEKTYAFYRILQKKLFTMNFPILEKCLRKTQHCQVSDILAKTKTHKDTSSKEMKGWRLQVEIKKNEVLEEAVKRHIGVISEVVDLDQSKILDTLLSFDIITTDQIAYIKMNGSPQWRFLMLTQMLSKNDFLKPVAFKQFLDSLRKDYPSLVEQIEINCCKNLFPDWVKKYIDLDNGFADVLYASHILDFQKLNKVKQNKDVRKKNNVEFVDEILNNAVVLNSFTSVLQALLETKQNHIYWSILKWWSFSGLGYSKCTARYPLTSAELDSIDNNLFVLCDLMDPFKEHFLYRLLSCGCITSSHVDRIKAGKTTRDKNHQLFEILKRRSMADMKSFLICLRETNQIQIVRILEDNDCILPINIQLENLDRCGIKHAVDMLNAMINFDHSYMTDKELEALESYQTIDGVGDVEILGASEGEQLRVYFVAKSFTHLLQLISTQIWKTGFEKLINSIVFDPDHFQQSRTCLLHESNIDKTFHHKACSITVKFQWTDCVRLSMDSIIACDISALKRYDPTISKKFPKRSELSQNERKIASELISKAEIVDRDGLNVVLRIRNLDSFAMVKYLLISGRFLKIIEDLASTKYSIRLNKNYDLLFPRCADLNSLPTNVMELVSHKILCIRWKQHPSHPYFNCDFEKFNESERNRGIVISVVTNFMQLEWLSALHSIFKTKTIYDRTKIKLLSSIVRYGMRKSRPVLIERLTNQRLVLEDLRLKNLISAEGADLFEKASGDKLRMNEMLVLLMERKDFDGIMQFIEILEETYQRHFSNHICVHTITRLAFGSEFECGNSFPLKESARQILIVNHHKLICLMNPMAQISVNWTSCNNFIDILFESKIIPLSAKNEILMQTCASTRNELILEILRNNSNATFKMALQYFSDTGQHDVCSMMSNGDIEHIYSNYEVLKAFLDISHFRFLQHLSNANVINHRDIYLFESMPPEERNAVFLSLILLEIKKNPVVIMHFIEALNLTHQEKLANLISVSSSKDDACDFRLLTNQELIELRNLRPLLFITSAYFYNIPMLLFSKGCITLRQYNELISTAGKSFMLGDKYLSADTLLSVMKKRSFADFKQLKRILRDIILQYFDNILDQFKQNRHCCSEVELARSVKSLIIGDSDHVDQMMSAEDEEEKIQDILTRLETIC